MWPVVATSSPQRYRTRRAVLYSVSERDNPTHIKVFEIYRNVDAYKSHLESAHFKNYKLATETMVKALKLVPTVPVILGKARQDDN